MLPLRIPKIVLLLTSALSCMSAEAAVISRVTQQSGEVAEISPAGRLVRIGTFSSISPNMYTQVRISGTAKNALDFVGADLPRLYFTKPNASAIEFLEGLLPAPLGPVPVMTDAVIETHLPELIESVTSGFVPLTAGQTLAINSLLSSNSNQIEAWMFSGNISDFYFPSFQESIVSFVPFVTIIETFDAELSFVAVPEPTTASSILVGLGVGMAALHRRRRIAPKRGEYS